MAVAEQELLAAYDAVTVAHPELADRLAPFRADHVAHLHGLDAGSYTLDGGATDAWHFEHRPFERRGFEPAAGRHRRRERPPTSPPASTAILRQLADLERAAAQARVNDVVTTSGSLARFVASIGGCEAAHAALLSVAT